MTEHDTGNNEDGPKGDAASNADAAVEPERAEWVAVGTYTTGLEADIARGMLESSDIPVLTKGEQPGIFGGGYAGNISGGIVLHVPSPEVERAKQLLSMDGISDGEPE